MTGWLVSPRIDLFLPASASQMPRLQARTPQLTSGLQARAPQLTSGDGTRGCKASRLRCRPSHQAPFPTCISRVQWCMPVSSELRRRRQKDWSVCHLQLHSEIQASLVCLRLGLKKKTGEGSLCPGRCCGSCRPSMSEAAGLGRDGVCAAACSCLRNSFQRSLLR